MTKNSITRGWSCARIVIKVTGILGHQAVFTSTVYKVLTKHDYSVFKWIVKPGLTDKAKKARLAWCLKREHWTLED
jgi:hypothetical protein